MIEVGSLDVLSKIVLVVEDNSMIRMLLVEVLLGADFVTMEAENASSALTLLNTHGIKINLVLTDVHMPGVMDGLMLTQHVYSVWPSIALIIVSGGVKPLLRDMPLGSRFLAKPYNIDHLIRNIHQMTSAS